VRRGLAYAGIFAAALAALMLEILLTRIISVIGWYHLAFFVIALAMLGMTAGAAAVFLWPRWFADVPRRLAESALAFAAVAPPAFAWTMAGPLMPVTDLMGFMSLLGLGVVLALPFALVGVTLTLALTRAGLAPGLAYGIDLLGAALGCLLVIPLLDAVDAASAVLVAGAIAGAAALAFGLARGTGRKDQALALAITAVWTAAALGNAAAGVPPLRPAWVKGEHEDLREFDHVEWNTHSRVTVSRPAMHPPRLWAAGRNLPLELALRPIEERTLKIDGAAETGMARYAGSDHGYLEWDVATFAHRLRPHGAAAVIGVGGGRDVLEAVRVGHAPVVGVEINEKIVALHAGPLADYAGIAGLPGVELVADEARSFFARDERRYEVITMSLIDTWASTGAGAYSLSENGLYTVEGWQVFLRRLTPTGIFTVSRWYVTGSPGETGRMLALAMTTLWKNGARDPRAHLILLQQASVATLLVSPTPFAAKDLDRMQAEAVRLGFNMVMTPRKLPAPPLLRAIAEQPDAASLAAFAGGQELDMTPPDDDRPFFFNMLRPGAWLADKGEVDAMDLSFLGNLQATQTLVYATLVSVVLTIVAVFGPLWLRRRELGGGPTVAAACAYFALIGLHVRGDRAAVAGRGVLGAPDAGAGGGARGDHPGDGGRQSAERVGAGAAAAGRAVLPAAAGAARGRGPGRAGAGDDGLRGGVAGHAGGDDAVAGGAAGPGDGAVLPAGAAAGPWSRRGGRDGHHAVAVGGQRGVRGVCQRARAGDVDGVGDLGDARGGRGVLLRLAAVHLVAGAARLSLR